MPSFGIDSFLSRGMTCDVLKMSGKNPEIKDRLANKTSKQDFSNSVGTLQNQKDAYWRKVNASWRRMNASRRKMSI